jgi:4-amino-4-deoxy-L-arabinose transferase-like glycosyltransferase
MHQSIPGFRDLLNKLDWEIPILLILPGLLLAASNSWILNPPGFIDPWVYTGHFLRFDQYLKAFSGTYYTSRLGWILPGHIIYKLFPPLVANYVLHILFYYVATLALYLILRYTINRRAALFTSLLMGCYSYFLLAIGWNYVDGAGITYYLLTLIAIVYSSKSRNPRIGLFLAGFFYGALVYTNIFCLVLTPTLIISYLCLHQSRCKRLIITNLIYIILGLFFITVLLGTINYNINKNFLFFLPSFNFVAKNSSIWGNSNPWKTNFKEWLPLARWLLLPTLTCVASVASLFASRLQKHKRPAHLSVFYLFQVNHLLNFLIFLSIEISFSPALQLPFYASYLIPSTFLAIAAQLQASLNSIRKSQFIFFCLVTIASSLIFYRGWSDGDIWQSNTPANLLTLFFTLIGIFLIAVTHYFSRPSNLTKKPSHILLLTLILFIYILSSPRNIWAVYGNVSNAHLLNTIESPPLDSWLYYPFSKQEIFLTTVQAQKLLREIDPDVQFLFWYNLHENPTYRSIASSSLWGYRLVSERLPELPLPIEKQNQKESLLRLRTLLRGFPKIAIFHGREDTLTQASASLEKLGFNVKFLSRYFIKQGNQNFMMTLIEVYDGQEK